MDRKIDYDYYCNPGVSEQVQRPQSRGMRPETAYTTEVHDYQRYNYTSDYNCNRNLKQYENNYTMSDEACDALAALRQRTCNLLSSELEAMTEAPYQPRECPPSRSGAGLRRQADLIDYVPESEFLRRMKQQCEYLRKNQENIFSYLDELGLDYPLDYSQSQGNYVSNDQSNIYKTASAGLDYYECGQRPMYKNDGISEHPSAGKLLSDNRDIYKMRGKLTERKSEHISRSKKPGYRGRRKRPTSEKSESGERFEPTLKKPHEDSCDRCWRYASPARSPVNKPDQKFDPNFRKAHSYTDFEKGDGNRQDTSRPTSPYSVAQPSASREKNMPPTQFPETWKKDEVPLREPIGQQQEIMQKTSRPATAYAGTLVPKPGAKGEFIDKPTPTPSSHASQRYQAQIRNQAEPPLQNYIRMACRPAPSQSKVQETTYEFVPSRSAERNVGRLQPTEKPAMNSRMFYDSGRPPRPKSCTPGIGYRETYKSNVPVGNTLQDFRSTFRGTVDPSVASTCLDTNLQRQQLRGEVPLSSFVAPGLFSPRECSPRPCKCCGYSVLPQQDVAVPCPPPHCENCPMALPGGLPQGERPPSAPDGRPSPKVGVSNRQFKTIGVKEGPKTPRDRTKQLTPKTDARVYAEVKDSKHARDGKNQLSTIEGTGKKGTVRTPSPKRSGKIKGEGEKSPKGSPSFQKQKSESPSSQKQKSGRSSKSKSPSKHKISKSKSPSKSTKLSSMGDISTKSERSSKARTSPSKRSPSPKSPKHSSKSPSRRQTKGTNQAEKSPPNEMRCSFEENERPLSACLDMRELNCAQAYSSGPCMPEQINLPVNRDCCCCTPRVPRFGPCFNRDQSLDYILCCHCKWQRVGQNCNSQFPSIAHGPKINRTIGQNMNWRSNCFDSVSPARNVTTEVFNQNPTGNYNEDWYVRYPYKELDQTWTPPPPPRPFETQRTYQGINGSVRERQNFSQPPYCYDTNPKTYFVFYMTKCKQDKPENVEVLVEEMSQACPDNKDTKARDLTEKMKKIMEVPQDSMALRFQKGVVESCKPPQSSRILYF